MMFRKSMIACAVAALLAACGGGGGEPSSASTPALAVNKAPVADAGPAQSVLTGATITLTGGASTDPDADALTYRWSLDSKPVGSSAQLSDPAAVMPTWRADVAGAYVFSLLVNDGKASSVASTVSVTAAVANAAPVAHTGVAQSVTTGTLVTLDASASSDANGDALSYAWTLSSKPAGSTASLSNASSAGPTFTADLAGAYVASLVASDGALQSAVATVTVSAAVANVAPVANAGVAQNVTTGTLVTLDGSASSDANGDALTYAWTLTSKPAGSAAGLINPNSAKPSMTADAAGTYVGTLIVSDGKLSGTAKTVTVTAAVANVAPVANAGTAQNVITATLVTLDGSASSDANGDSLTYLWTLTSKPVGSTASLANPTSPKPTFTADVAGSYVGTLTVNDGKVSGAAQTVAVTAVVANAVPVANAGAAQNVTIGSLVTLDGSASSDANNDPLTYAWSLTSKPAGSTASLGNSTSPRSMFTADLAGSYVGTLTVNDGKASGAGSTVAITAVAPKISLFNIADSLFGATRTEQQFPYLNSASASASSTCVGNGCPSAYVVDTFEVTAAGQRYTINGLATANLTVGSLVQPTFSGLANAQSIDAGQTVRFKLLSPFTGGQSVTLRYSFGVVETGQTFTYTVTLRTN